jgi:DNA repair exonuclease SbcCD nuclease subunit
MFRIIHLSDLHLDTSFAISGLPATTGAWRRADLRATLGRILALARERRVDAVTIAGDLYEQEYALPDTADFLVQQLAKLAPIRVFIAPGKSDPYTNDSLYALTRWPANVTIFSQSQLTPLEIAANIHLWAAAYPLARGYRTLHQFHVNRDGTNILLLHAADIEEQGLGDESMFSVSASTIREAGFNIAVLGCRHSARIWPDGSPYCIYPGSPEPLDSLEAAGQHQVMFLTIEDGRCAIEQIPVSQWRFLSCDVDLSGCVSIKAAATRIARALHDADDERSIWKVALTGVLDFDLDVDALVGEVKTKAHVEYDVRLEIPYELEQLAHERTVRGLLAQRFQVRLAAVQSDQERRIVQSALNAALRALAGKRELPHEIG